MSFKFSPSARLRLSPLLSFKFFNLYEGTERSLKNITTQGRLSQPPRVAEGRVWKRDFLNLCHSLDLLVNNITLP